MRKVLFVADDFGISPEVNRAIAEAFEWGALDGASLMVDQAATSEAAAMARADPSVRCGIHLNFTDVRDTGSAAWEPFPWAQNPLAATLAARNAGHASRFAAETRQQFRAYRDLELSLSFINAHHHLHVLPVIYQAILDALQEFFPQFDGWMRLGSAYFLGLPGATTLASAARFFGALRDPAWPHARSDAFALGAVLPGRCQRFAITDSAVRRLVLRRKHACLEVIFHPGANKCGPRPEGRGDDGQDRSGESRALRALGTWRG